ncbi:MAG: hypothetical protein H7Y88_02205 [Phycisphaerales bacterium]|nr:hypothetical protein [Phycisphaerales bacterium]
MTDSIKPIAKPVEGRGGAWGGASFPVSIPTVLGDAEILARLETAAKRGKLPGFHAGGAGGSLFVVRDFGRPFESELRARRASGHQIELNVALRPMAPWIFIVLSVLTVWPGVYFFESFLGLFPGSADWMWSGWWYIPLAVVTGAWGVWAALRGSKRSGAAEGVELVERVRGVLDRAGLAPGPVP